MNPVFRALTRCNRSLDAAIYDTFPKDQSKEAFTQWCMLLGSVGYLSIQLFAWGLTSMQLLNWILTIFSIAVLVGAIRGINERSHSRERYLKSKDEKRREKVGSGELLMGVLFYSDHLVQYNMLAGKAERLEYEEVTDIRVIENYIFLLTKSKIGMISLEKAGLAGKSPYDAVRWLAVRCGCKLPK